VHWDVRGNPNGWSTRDVPGVFGLPILGAVVMAFVEGAAAITRSRAQGPSTLAAVRQAGVHFVRVTNCGLALVFGWLAIDLPLGPRMPSGLLTAVLLVPLVGAMVLGSARMRSVLVDARRTGQGASVEGYRSFYYANKKDSRLVVPKLYGTGWTVNFANPWAWPMILLLLAAPVGLVLGLSR
jgi:uncharacterized membrane protein